MDGDLNSCALEEGMEDDRVIWLCSTALLSEYCGAWQVIVVLVVAGGEMTALSARHAILSLRVVRVAQLGNM